MFIALKKFPGCERMLKTTFGFGAVGIFIFFLVTSSHANITEPGAIGVRAAGMSGAMEGTPVDLISAFYYNPAGLTKLAGQRIAFSVLSPNIRFRYKNESGYSRMNHTMPFLPVFGYATDRYKPVIIGLGMYSSMGTGFNFKRAPSLGIPNNIESRIGVLSLLPTVAFRIHSRVAVGIELNVGYGKGEIEQPTPGGFLEVDADGIGFGGILGVLFEVNPALSFGIKLQSPMKSSLKGDAYLDGRKDDIDIEIYWPLMISFGIGYQPNPQFTLGISMKWADWTYFDRSKFSFDELKFLDRPLAKGSRDTVRVSIGMEHYLSKWLALRCGYFYDQYSTDSAWISPMLPDMSSHHITTGIGIIWRQWEFDLATDYVLYLKRKIHTSMSGYPGEYSGYIPVIALEASYRF